MIKILEELIKNEAKIEVFYLNEKVETYLKKLMPEEDNFLYETESIIENYEEDPSKIESKMTLAVYLNREALNKDLRELKDSLISSGWEEIKENKFYRENQNIDYSIHSELITLDKIIEKDGKIFIVSQNLKT